MTATSIDRSSTGAAEFSPRLVAAAVKFGPGFARLFPDKCRAAAELHRICEEEGVSLNSACRALGLKQSTVQCDAQIWRRFGDIYSEMNSVCPGVRRSHLRELLRLETPQRALVCLKAVTVNASASGQRLTVAQISRAIAVSISDGDSALPEPSKRRTTKTSVKAAADRAHSKARAWDPNHVATDLLGRAARELEATAS